MANMARNDQQNRTVEVNREELIKTLEANRAKHVREYEDAMAGYKSVLASKLEDAYTDAKAKIDKQYRRLKDRIDDMSDDEIGKQQDWFTLLDEISVQLKVPRSFADDYDAAIDIAKWDVRETLELSHAEFTCFVRDQWDWKSGFEAVSTQYIGAMKF